MDDLVIIHKKIKGPQVMAPPPAQAALSDFLNHIVRKKEQDRYGVVKSSGYSKAAST